MALSGLRRPRRCPPRGRIDRRLDGGRGYGGSGGETSCRTCRLTFRATGPSYGSVRRRGRGGRTEEHTAEIQSLMGNSYTGVWLKKKKKAYRNRNLPRTSHKDKYSTQTHT